MHRSSIHANFIGSQPVRTAKSVAHRIRNGEVVHARGEAIAGGVHQTLAGVLGTGDLRSRATAVGQSPRRLQGPIVRLDVDLDVGPNAWHGR